MNSFGAWVRGKWDIILYVLIGILTTVVNWIAYTGFILWLDNVAVSNGLAWCIAVLFAYVTNKIFVFKQRSWTFATVLREFSLFITARVGTGVLEMVGVPFLVSVGLNARIFNVQGALAKIIVSVFVVILNYIFSKMIVFQNKTAAPHTESSDKQKGTNLPEPQANHVHATTVPQANKTSEPSTDESTEPAAAANIKPNIMRKASRLEQRTLTDIPELSSLKQNRVSIWVESAVMLILAMGFGFFIATALCPVMPEGGFDSTVFLLTGKGWLHGLIPYRDYFDHKGPILYAIEALAMLPYPSGSMVWGAEVLFFLASLWLIRSIAIMEKAAVPVRCLVYISYTLLLATCMEKGNFSEEYSALFTLLAYWALLNATTKRFRWWIGSVMGGAFAFAFWIRPNNALPLCCAIAALAIILLWHKRFRQLIVLILSGFGAAGLVSLLIGGYFYANHALHDLIACFFTFNTQNVAHFSTANPYQGLLTTYFGRYSIMAILLGIAAPGYAMAGNAVGRSRKLAVMAGTLIAILSCWISHNPFFHYFMLAMPTLALGLLYFYQQVWLNLTQDLHAIRARKACFTLGLLARVVLVVAVLYCGSVFARHAAGALIQAKRESVDENLANRLGSLSQVIPADEYADTLVIASDNLILWYEVQNQLPIKKYYFGYDFIAQADAQRGQEITRQFEKDAPKWILINAGDAELQPTAQILNKYYHLEGVNRNVQLYRLTE